MKKQFAANLATLSLALDQQQQLQFDLYYELLVEWNERMNLTSITAEDEVYKKHFWDSLTPVRSFDFHRITSLCDVGSGAGFPSLVLKIVFPHLKITIVEALHKRTVFLREVIAKLQLTNVEVIHDRAEVYAKSHRERFDVVIARAVANLTLLSELCVPMIKLQGTFIVMKGMHGDNELQQAQQMLKQLGIGQIKRTQLFLEQQTDERILFFCVKTSLTPKQYPRPFSQIKKDSIESM